MAVTLQETSICLRGQACTVTTRQACLMQDTDRQQTPDHGFTCDTCIRDCSSWICLFSHRRSHLLSSGDPSSQQLSPTLAI